MEWMKQIWCTIGLHKWREEDLIRTCKQCYKKQEYVFTMIDSGWNDIENQTLI